MVALNSNLKDAEINWQEYLISKEKAYLNAYQESRALVDSVYDVLSVSTNVNPEEKKRLESMHTMIKKKYHLLDEELEIFNKSHFKVNDSILSKEQQNKLMIDSIAAVSESIAAYEKNMLLVRTRKVTYYSKVVFWIIIGAGLISGLLIIYSLVTFNMESQAKRNATKQAETYHD